ncbi:winged helix-turn-helix transcriptional regulator [Mycobacterium sp. Aquia_213]|uniref:winged helix-turn-helix transcriptional regulator n=1 Tax=Mycobacterium sp. Aquia_213 TaxID=2991728 RepID=UPI00227108D5|nr:helix-turn-helix domain-containing protein [Mycobacterium sp. Aquia_213]WAC91194.1 helix-turn-helix domain-containing protein [Mycobacterium sp. Aquia_213]
MSDLRDHYVADNCSIKRALDVVGEKWTLLVMREAFYGARRFDQFQARIGCARNILSERLLTLTEAGILRRVPYREPGQRERHEYRLTDKGLDLITAVIALMQWGDRWEADEDGPPVTILHDDCGHPVEAILHCPHDGTLLTARDLHPVPGPGAQPAPGA